MAKKIYIDGSALVVKDTIDLQIEFTRPAEDCWYDEGYLQEDLVVLTYLGRPSHKYPISETVDLNGNVFTTDSFRDFIYNNVGDNAQGGRW